MVIASEDSSIKWASNNAVFETISKWKKALVTNEDYLHHHKILGVLCLISFVYRICHMMDDFAFPSHPEWTIPTLAIHWMLPASSFQFKIPQKRIIDGARIWPQYRLHTFIFSTRSIILLARYWYEQNHQLAPNYEFNFAVAILTMAAADFVTYATGDPSRPNTIRDLAAPGSTKFFFSLMQFNATTGVIFGLRSFAIPFFMMFVVQTTPFVGTLRRKGVFTSDLWGAIFYGLFLSGGFVVQAIQYTQAGGEKLHLFVRSIALLAAFMRLTPFLPSFCCPMQNKYVIWTSMYLIIKHFRSNIDQLDICTLRVVAFVLLTSLVASCRLKINNGFYAPYQNNKKVE